MKSYFTYVKRAILITTVFLAILLDTGYSQWEDCENSSCPNMGNYTINGGHWYKSELKYYFANGTDDIADDLEKTAFEAAFNTWENAVPFTVIETFSSNDADIFIKFVQDGDEWLSSGQTESRVAVSWYPETNCQGVLLLNNWYHSFSLQQNPPNAKDLQAVALHELGHILGLCHSNNSATVMYYAISNPNKRTLHSYDIEGINVIYDRVAVKNKFVNPDASVSYGGTINVDYQNYDTQNELNNEKLFAFNDGSTRHFDALNQSYQTIERKFNSNQDHQGGWFKNNSLISLNSVMDQQIDDATFMATYKYKATINLIAETEFDNTQSLGSIGQIYQYESGPITAPTPKLINGKNYNFVWWTDNKSSSNPRTITPTGNQTYTNLYKYPNHSSSTQAYVNNNQRKVVRTDYNGYLHKVYSSMGYAWYEISSDNGVTWSIANNGRPLSTLESKLPSLDVQMSTVVIVFQERTSSDHFKIKIAHFNMVGLPLGTVQDVSGLNDDNYSIDASPVVAYGTNGYLMVAWRIEDLSYQEGIYYRFGYLPEVYGDILWYMDEIEGFISGTNFNSTNPTLALRKDGSTIKFHLAWKQSNDINYCSLFKESDNSITVSGTENVSNGSGYTYNEQPSIITVGDYPKIVWVGKRYIGAWEIRTVRRVKSALGWGATFDKYGNNVASPTTAYVNSNDITAWSENNGSANKFWRWGSIRSFGTMGKDIQLSNAPDLNSMYAVGFRLISPYYFYVTPSVGSIAKENLIVNNSGREGIIKKAEAEFYFIIGDVSADNQTINFTEFDNDIQFENTSQLNDALVSNSFDLTDNSNLVLSVAFGTKDSASAVNSLSSTDQLTFKIQLIDEMTGELLGEYDNVTYNKDNVIPYENISYQINTSGIGNRTVVLKLIVDNNFDAEYFAADIKADAEILGKNSYTEISYKGNLAVDSYDLSQNYPNPFNPSTTIKYQIPNAGDVTLKIYDILGREVTTLVDGFKNEGRYEVNFNASKLASGVYIYTIKSNDFTASKKLMLLK